MKKLTTIVLSAAILLVILTGCSAASAFESQVKSGNYTKAIEIYNTKLAGNTQSEQEAITFLEKYLDEGWTQYADGKIDDKAFNTLFATVEKINSELWLLPDLSDISSKYEAVRASKESYDSGMAHADAEEYAEAISELSAVVSDDTENYDSAQEKLNEITNTYIADVLESASQLTDKNDYDGALDLLKNAENVIGTNAEFAERAKEVATQKYQKAINDAVADSDYVTVINQYAEANNNGVTISSGMTESYTNSVSLYLDDLSQKAQDAFGEGKDYAAATEILRAGLAEVSTDDAVVSEIEAKIAEYAAFEPVPLTSLEYTQKSYYIKIGDADSGEATDASGNVYNANTVIQPCPRNNKNSPEPEDKYVVYNLNFEYSTLSGVVYRPYHALSADASNWDVNTTVKILGDDVLLYEAPSITENTYDPIHFDVNVTGVRNLKIIVSGFWTEPSGWGFDMIYPRVCMAEVKLQK